MNCDFIEKDNQEHQEGSEFENKDARPKDKQIQTGA